MPRGGKRAGAGRPAKLPSIIKVHHGDVLPAIMDAVDFLVDVASDDSVSIDLRIKAAIAAAPYQRAKVGSAGIVGKKQLLKEAASEPAEDGSGWEHLE